MVSPSRLVSVSAISTFQLCVVIVEATDSAGRTWNQPPKPSWRSVPNNTELSDPGWTPRPVHMQHPPRHPVVSVLQQHQQPHPHHRQYPHPVPVRHTDEVPAWYGSLRSATDPKLSDRKVIVSRSFNVDVINVRKKTINVYYAQEHQCVAVRPGNEHFISIRQVSLRRGTCEKCRVARRCYTSAPLLLQHHAIRQFTD